MKGDRAPVLFVCTGNTCRSPLAAALWTQVAPDWPVLSAGTDAWPGAPAADEAQEVAREYGADLSGHRARRVRDVTEPVGHVFTMTRAQKQAVLAERPDWADRVFVLTEAAGEEGDIPDPFGASVAVYRALAERLVNLERKVFERLAREAEGPEASSGEDGAPDGAAPPEGGQNEEA
ncbi:MAG: low molecular weight protein arginine phosphatase [Actinomycetia bacterium]|nr:low molecular weight protein arginine phosphatase [Actinomycetes bacterium]